MFSINTTTNLALPVPRRTTEELIALFDFTEAFYPGRIPLRLGNANFTIDHRSLQTAIVTLTSAEGPVTKKMIYDLILAPNGTDLSPIVTRSQSDTLPRNSVFYNHVKWDPTNWPRENALPGAYVLVGDTNSGKTHYLRNLAGIDVLLRWGEPNEDADDAEATIGVDTLDKVIAMTLLLGCLGYRVGVDSLRTLVYSSDGNTIEGGMSSIMFDVATNLSNLYAHFGASIYLVINPMISDIDRETRLYSRLASAAAGALHIVNRQVISAQYRTSTGRVTLGVDDEASGPTTLPDEATRGTFTSDIAFGDDELASAVGRMYSTDGVSQDVVDRIDPPRTAFPRLKF